MFALKQRIKLRHVTCADHKSNGRKSNPWAKGGLSCSDTPGAKNYPSRSAKGWGPRALFHKEALFINTMQFQREPILRFNQEGNDLVWIYVLNLPHLKKEKKRKN